MIKRMKTSYDMLLDIMNTTVALIQDVKDHRLETTNIKVQIAILTDMIKSFKNLRSDLIEIEKEVIKEESLNKKD